MFHVGDIIRKLREQRGWTLQAFATVSHVNKGSISSIERGGNYQRDTIVKIARAFGLTAARLESKIREWAEAEVGPVSLTDDQRAMLEAWAGLEADGKLAYLGEMQREAELVARARQNDKEKLDAPPAIAAMPEPKRRGGAR